MHTTGHYMILGLAGRAGAGKDTAADVLCAGHGFFRMAFADALRREIVEAFGIDPGLFAVDTKEVTTSALAIGRCNHGDFLSLMMRAGYSASTPRSPRQIMRWWGTEFRRAQNPDYWLDRAAETLDAALQRGYRRIVITDLRFCNEANFIRRYNGQIWRIRRDVVDKRPIEHESEAQIPFIYSDATVENNGSMVAFAAAVMRTFDAQAPQPQNLSL